MAPEILSGFDRPFRRARRQSNVGVVGEAHVPACLFEGLAPFEQFGLECMERSLRAEADQICSA